MKMGRMIDSSVYSIYTNTVWSRARDEGAFGVVFLNNIKESIFEHGQVVRGETSHSVEYFAVVESLKLLGMRGNSDVLFRINNEVVAKQLNEKYNVNDERLEGLVGELNGLGAFFRSVRYEHALKDDEWISRAKVLAREAC
jgi:ribonuclease HI